MVAGSLAEGAGAVSSSDKWALRYIGVNYARNILEAFDEDASGFVTVKEVNDFTRSRPLDWRWVLGKLCLALPAHTDHSLPHWLAYWATGLPLFLVDRVSFRLTVTRLADDFHKLL